MVLRMFDVHQGERPSAEQMCEMRGDQQQMPLLPLRTRVAAEAADHCGISVVLPGMQVEIF